MGLFPTSSQRYLNQARSSIIGQFDEGTHKIQVNVFLITATNTPIDDYDYLSKGKFRDDLYYRLADSQIKLPPLNSRPEDIFLIFSYLLESKTKQLNGIWPKNIHPDVKEYLLNFNWDSNGNLHKLTSLALDVAENTKQWEDITLRHLPLMSKDIYKLNSKSIQDNSNNLRTKVQPTINNDIDYLINIIGAFEFDDSTRGSR